MPVGDIQNAIHLHLGGAGSVFSSLFSDGMVPLYAMAFLFAVACAYFGYWQFRRSLPFVEQPEAHETDPELLNFRLAEPYRRPAENLRPPNRVDFSNRLRLGDIEIAQVPSVYPNGQVYFYMESLHSPEWPLRLHFHFSGDPTVPADLKSVASRFFEDPSTSFDHEQEEWEHYELLFTRKAPDFYTLTPIEKEGPADGLVLHRLADD